MPTTTRSKAKQTRLVPGRDFSTDDKAHTTKDDLTKSRTGKAEPRDDGASGPQATGGGGGSGGGDLKQPKKSPPVSSGTKRRRGQEQPQPQPSRDGSRSPSPSPPAKRQQQQQHLKKQKQISSSGEITSPSPAPAPPASKESKPILINRAPVLQLWAACVTQFLYPDTTWSTCLAIGSQISTLCAISKGRRIGTIEPEGTAAADGKNEEKEKKKRKKMAESADGEEVDVMGFTLHMNGDGEVVVQGKPKKANEGLLRGKFAHGEEDGQEGQEDGYERVKSAMNDVLVSWKGTGKEKEELNRRAFAMYERFRPSVQSGQRGWGRKGMLKLEEIHEAVHCGA